MIFFWVLLQTVAGLLMSLAHPFRFNDFSHQPGIFSFILASLGIALFMKVSSLRRKKLSRFLLGFWSGLIYFGISLYWIFTALSEFANVPLLVSILGTLALAAYCAVYMGLWSLVSGFRWLQEKPLYLRMLLWASLWAGLESLREHLFTGFTWAELGYFFAAWPFIAKSASVWGVHGLTFVWILFVSLLLHADDWIFDKQSRRKAIALVAATLLIGVGGTWWYSAGRETESRRISAIQPNISQKTKWSHQLASDHLNLLIDLTRAAVSEQPDLIVWPETSYPFLINPNQKSLPFQSPTPLVIGGVISDRQLNRNSAILVLGNQIAAAFDKIHLVPFGEYVPFEDYMPFEKLVANSGNFRAGSEDQPLLEIADKNLKMGPLICYEDIFSWPSVRHAQNGANLLLNITNDGWYGRSSALEQHAAIAALQVYSTGLPMLRATNTGYSVAIGWDFFESLPMHETNMKTFELQIPTKDHKTLYVMSYPYTQWLWLGIFLLSSVLRFTRPKKRIFFKSLS